MTDDDLEVGGATPVLNDRASITLDGDARVLLREETPSLTATLDPAPGASLRQGSSVSGVWSATSQVGLAKTMRAWTANGSTQNTWLVNQALVGGEATMTLQVPSTAPPGPAVLTLTAIDLAGRTVARSESWSIIENPKPTGTLTVSPGAGVLPNHTVVATVAAQDDRGLKSGTVVFTGPGLSLSHPHVFEGGPTSGQFSADLKIPIYTPSGGQVHADAGLEDLEQGHTSLPRQSIPILPDTIVPTIQQQSPQSGATVSEGQIVTFQFAILDDVGVQQATLVVNGGQPQTLQVTGGAELTQSTWRGFVSSTWRAPDVDVATLVPFELTLQDLAGHSASLQGTLTVNPVNNTTAPKFTLECPRSRGCCPRGAESFASVHGE
ncbi:MAG: Ig-like domain-containing protein [Thermoanaerobaculaceae bacterium]